MLSYASQRQVGWGFTEPSVCGHGLKLPSLFLSGFQSNLSNERHCIPPSPYILCFIIWGIMCISAQQTKKKTSIQRCISLSNFQMLHEPVITLRSHCLPDSCKISVSEPWCINRLFIHLLSITWIFNIKIVIIPR